MNLPYLLVFYARRIQLCVNFKLFEFGHETILLRMCVPRFCDLYNPKYWLVWKIKYSRLLIWKIVPFPTCSIRERPLTNPNIRLVKNMQQGLVKGMKNQFQSLLQLQIVCLVFTDCHSVVYFCCISYIFWCSYIGYF